MPLLRGSLRVLVAFAALVLLQLAAASVVLADNGPHVQGAAGSGSGIAVASDGCAACHRAHAASGPSLLAQSDPKDLCYSCHGTASLGATTNVENGVLAASTQGLLGGGFRTASMNTAWTSTVAGQADVTSMHGDMTEGATRWGSGPIGSGPGEKPFSLTCTTCHDPHGNGQYRILVPIPSGAADGTSVTVPDPVIKVYTIGNVQNKYFGHLYEGDSYDFQVQLDRWCAACHNRYDATGANSATTSSGDPIYKFRHGTRIVQAGNGNCDACHERSNGSGPAVNILGISADLAHVPVCENCHVAHGTSALMGSVANNVPYPDGTTTARGEVHSTLLRLDGRGVCRACHGK
jgi:predicted CXXCH cytochrome family protein